MRVKVPEALRCFKNLGVSNKEHSCITNIDSKGFLVFPKDPRGTVNRYSSLIDTLLSGHAGTGQGPRPLDLGLQLFF